MWIHRCGSLVELRGLTRIKFLRSAYLCWLGLVTLPAGRCRRLVLVGGGEGREWAEYTSNKAASVATVVTQNWCSCAGRCGHAVASVGAVLAPSRDRSPLCIVRGMYSVSVYDIVRYLRAAIIAGLPHPRSISRYRLIDKNPSWSQEQYTNRKDQRGWI